MDMKAALLIILNLILIESLLSISNAFAIGAVLGGMPEEKRNKRFKIVIVSTVFIRAFLLVFVSFLLYTYITIGAILILYSALLYFVFADQRKYSGVSFLMLGLLLIALFVLDVLYVARTNSIHPAVAFTDNIYLIVFGISIGLIVYASMIYVVMKWAARMPLVKFCGYLCLFSIALRATVYLVLLMQGKPYFGGDDQVDLFLNLAFVFVMVGIILYYKVKK